MRSSKVAIFQYLGVNNGFSSGGINGIVDNMKTSSRTEHDPSVCH